MHIEKYHASGNDFIIIEDENLNIDTCFIKTILSNHIGIGADGLIKYNHHLKSVEFYNKDGSSAGLCINGLRCLTLFVVKKYGLLEEFVFNVDDRIYLSRVKSLIPFSAEIKIPNYSYFIEEISILDFDNNYPIGLIDIGNKHSIIISKGELSKEMLINKCKLYSVFEDRNINIVTLIDRNKIKISTYERGVGFTSSCGSGSISSIIYLKYLGLVNDIVEVINDSDSVFIKVNEEISLKGKVHFIFEGEYEF